MSDVKVALVTGASRGIGFVVATRLAEAGFNLAICSTSQATVDQAAEKIRAACGVEVLARAVDVSNSEQMQGFVQEAAKHFGRLDVLVNNAGITRDNLAMRMKQDEWHAVIDTNLTSVFNAMQAALKPMMRARSGRIINISSVVAGMGNPGQLNYCASKGGVEAMTRSLAREVASRGITVNAVAPGFIATDMTAGLGDEAHARLSEQIPLGRLGQPEDIAAAVLFLASEGAGYITGQVLHVNGGMYM
ncbi:3-oxoacyl-ACP reductase FabG [Mariprofundus erugo]|uniref:3-oxoacyl-[acyl-carrier-protein] reductase n=1 Tax=Mariprofundus erugo TaxID=2528639 RepID=A0A5R9GWI4_9PROT|nr:3-oxoacyl-ACP reductase FabG [Mariprofundus erugo]TLS69235.1 3-oxoacyl-ACP reductase FabG [Mariprofundus erugo]